MDEIADGRRSRSGNDDTWSGRRLPTTLALLIWILESDPAEGRREATNGAEAFASPAVTGLMTSTSNAGDRAWSHSTHHDRMPRQSWSSRRAASPTFRIRDARRCRPRLRANLAPDAPYFA